MKSTSDGKPSGRLAGKPKLLRLVDLKLFTLGAADGPNARHCSHVEFRDFISSTVGLGPGVEVNKWNVTRRRDVLNFCITNNLLEPGDGVLSRIKNSTEVNKSAEEIQPEKAV